MFGCCDDNKRKLSIAIEALESIKFYEESTLVKSSDPLVSSAASTIVGGIAQEALNQILGE